MSLKVGDKAPDFTLVDTERKERSLAEFIGKKTVIAFYPGAFTGVCTKEMCTLRDSLASFNGMNGQIVGISVDSPFANKGFASANNITYPLLSDFTHAVSMKYVGMYDDFAHIKGLKASKRSVFILDATGVIRYAWVTEDPGTEPPYEEIGAALKSA